MAPRVTDLKACEQFFLFLSLSSCLSLAHWSLFNKIVIYVLIFGRNKLATKKKTDDGRHSDHSRRLMVEILTSIWIAVNVSFVPILLVSYHFQPQQQRERPADKKMTATLITLIGKDTYTILKDLCYPDPLTSCKYSELVMKLKAHFSPKANVGV